MWSASALKRHCAYPNILSRSKTPSPDQQEAMARGTRFHVAAEKWIRSGEFTFMEDDLECQGWLDAFVAQFRPSSFVKVEIAWGLGEDGQHLMVAEPRPHEYESMGGLPLITAGRADLMWGEGVRPEVRGIQRLYIIDYKTGRWDAEHPSTNLQVNAAGLALGQRFHAAEYIPGIYKARDAAFDWGDPVDLASTVAADMFEEVKAAALLPDTPIPGDHCGSCWEQRMKRCPSAQR
jgi:hypothetical protein